MPKYLKIYKNTIMKKIILLLLLLLLSIENALSQVEVVTNFSWAYATKVNNKIVFSHNTADYGKELWVSDGTTAGTMMLKDINPGPADSTPFHFTLLDDVVYFQENSNQIWRTDGTIGGTYMMVNNTQITNPTNFVKTQSFIFFQEGPSNSKTLWKMNTNPNSESEVTPTSNFSNIDGILLLNYDDDVILFNAKTSSIGWAIWRTNGGVSLMVKDLYTETSDSRQMYSGKTFGNECYFSGFSYNYGPELWKTDGTLPNTNLVKDIYIDNTLYYNGSSPSKFIKIGANIYFVARDGIHGYELWKTDGTAVGTQMVKDIDPDNNNNGGPYALTEFNGFLYFVHSEGTPTSSQIWKTDGTEVGTIKVSNIPNAYFSGSSEMFSFNNVLYFNFYNQDFGTELWKLDSNDNMSLLADITPGTEGSFPNGFFEFNGYIYFTAVLNNVPSGYKTYKIADQSLSVETIKKTNKISIFPNPTSDFININTDEITNFNIQIYDIVGKQIGNYKNQKAIDISNFTAGMYLIKIIDLENNIESSHKIIKK